MEPRQVEQESNKELIVVHCACCGRQMERGEVVMHNEDNGEPYFMYHCPEFLKLVADNDKKWFASNDSPHYSYNEYTESSFDHLPFQM